MKTNRICNEGENNEDNSNEGYNDEDQYEANELENSLKKSTEEIAEKWDTPFLKWKLTGKMEKTKLKVRKREKSEIEEEEFKALQVINKLASAEENRQMWDPDAFYIDVESKLMMPEAENDVCIPSLCFHERIFSFKFGDNISLVGISWR